MGYWEHEGSFTSQPLKVPRCSSVKVVFALRSNTVQAELKPMECAGLNAGMLGCILRHKDASTSPIKR